MTRALCREHKGVQCTRNTSRLEGKHSQLNNSGLDQIYCTPTAGRTHLAALHSPVSLRVGGQHTQSSGLSRSRHPSIPHKTGFHTHTQPHRPGQQHMSSRAHEGKPGAILGWRHRRLRPVRPRWRAWAKPRTRPHRGHLGEEYVSLQSGCLVRVVLLRARKSSPGSQGVSVR